MSSSHSPRHTRISANRSGGKLGGSKRKPNKGLAEKIVSHAATTGYTTDGWIRTCDILLHKQALCTRKTALTPTTTPIDDDGVAPSAISDRIFDDLGEQLNRLDDDGLRAVSACARRLAADA